MYLKLSEDKETPNKIRFTGVQDDVPFSIYIPKWRVPVPHPDKIIVSLLPGHTSFNLSITENQISDLPLLRNYPVHSHLVKDRNHSETIRYSPVGPEKNWEIGKPYIPHDLTHEQADELTVIIYW